MTRSLSIFNVLIKHKRNEKDQLNKLIDNLKLEIKHTNEATFTQKAISANFIRQTNFFDKFKERNQKGNYF